MKVAAIDQGTTSTRILLADGPDLSIQHSLIHPQSYPHPGWVEQDPETLLKNIRVCLETVGPVDRLGIANQGESCLAWDRKTGETITAVIVWQDSRTRETTEKLKAEGAEHITLERAGLPLDPYFSGSKLGWIINHIPRAQGLLKTGDLCLGTTDSFFLFRLTGEFATDITTASRTSLMNLKTGCWDPVLCDLFGVPLEALPEIRPTTGSFGKVCIDNVEVPITANVVDQQASLYGHGCRTSGDVKVTFGTGAFALAVTGTTPIQTNDGGLLPTIAWQLGSNKPVYAIDGGVYNAGSALDWVRSLGLFSQFEDINTFQSDSAISRGLAFVPALSGLGCPHWDWSATGLWIGLSLEHNAMDLVQAVLEGIAFRTAEVIESLEKSGPINKLSIDGGLSRNRYFVHFLADVLEKEVAIQSFDELTAYGCALLASTDKTLAQYISGHTVIKPIKTSYTDDMQIARQRFSDAISRSTSWKL